jgi:hypothetical protein
MNGFGMHPLVLQAHFMIWKFVVNVIVEDFG